MARPGTPPSSPTPPRRLITAEDFEPGECDNVEVQSLIKAHLKTLDDEEWTALDDTELELYVKNRLYRKDKPHNKTTPVNHSLYRHMNCGPQYQTRASHLFVHAMWDHHNLAAFDKAIEKHGFAPAAPKGLFRMGDGKGYEKLDRPAPADWPDDKPKVTEVFKDAVKACKQQAAASRRPKESAEVNHHTSQCFAPLLLPEKLMATQQDISAEPSGEELEESDAATVESIAPRKRSRRDRTPSLTSHSLAPKASAKRTLADTPADDTSEVATPKPAAKKVRFSSKTEDESGVRPLPALSSMQVKRPAIKEKPIDKNAELMKKLEDHALLLSGLEETTTRINALVEVQNNKSEERATSLREEVGDLKNQNTQLKALMEAMEEKHQESIHELKEQQTRMESEMNKMKQNHVQDTNQTRDLIWDLFEKLQEQGVLEGSSED
jgi:hypothetical protein